MLERALTHRSAGSKNGERLEFLGDAFLGFVVAQRLYAQCQGASEGKMSRMRAALVRKETLASVAKEWRFGDYIKLGVGELRSGGFRRDSILADSVESLIGAVLQDQGANAAESVIERLYGERLTSLVDVSPRKDPKSELQELLQADAGELPLYTVVNEAGPAHDREFTVVCEIVSRSINVKAKGKSRRAAEQNAARLALESMQP